MPIDNTPDNTQDREQAPRFGPISKAWKALELSYPIGSTEFRIQWEALFEVGNRQPLYLLMEQCIACCRDKDIKVPPEFYKLKRIAEEGEDEMVRIEVPNG